MPANLRIHLAAAASLLGLILIIALFWSYPRLLVYVLLAIVAILAYGALYLILAAWMDPKEKKPPPDVVNAVDTEPSAPSTTPDEGDTLPDSDASTRRPKTAASRKTTRKKTTRKKTTRKKTTP